MRLIRFNKPFAVLTQFRDAEGRSTLGDYIDLPGVYPAGRLDRDSEGLLLLTDSGPLQHAISDPRHKLPKTYWVQIEGDVGDEALAALARGVELRDGLTAPAVARRMAEPDVWPRDPPVRYRATIPTSWIELTITEGRNRQVRRMTAAVGHPTLRLIRYAIGTITLDGLAPGEWREVDPETANAIVTASRPPRQRKPNGRALETPRHRRGGRGARRPLSPGRRGG